jgi:ubiquinone/menaquinone biosynthesis C-methylase UbiE
MRPIEIKPQMTQIAQMQRGGKAAGRVGTTMRSVFFYLFHLCHLRHLRPWYVICVIGLCVSVGGAQQPIRVQHGRLFPPQDLGLLEAPDRDRWQRPDQVMDALAIAEASVVADVGAGSGFFTIRLARRVGPNGLVYAQDVQQEMYTAISRRVQREGLTNVRPILGTETDSRLPLGSMDAVLIVDAYHEAKDGAALLSSVARSIKPQGRIGVIDFKLDGLGPGPPLEERVGPDTVVEEAARAGLRLIRQESFLPFQYFLVFGRDGPKASPR